MNIRHRNSVSSVRSQSEILFSFLMVQWNATTSLIVLLVLKFQPSSDRQVPFARTNYHLMLPSYINVSSYHNQPVKKKHMKMHLVISEENTTIISATLYTITIFQHL
ncbi:hypothetical protein Bhyg_10790 [Pseudolycoriella hygida]|uniref:Uncharacterized protein n=1 Tax=Pseudolycoriella hygida TaxID=35572 RepID=A0A9Q0RZ10_9DIPT|nr:hypothetical protein Bhyg_10790 [Pseudolycoriella hygida]